MQELSRTECAWTLLLICNLDAPQLSKLGDMQQISVSLLMSACLTTSSSALVKALSEPQQQCGNQEATRQSVFSLQQLKLKTLCLVASQ